MCLFENGKTKSGPTVSVAHYAERRSNTAIDKVTVAERRPRVVENRSGKERNRRKTRFDSAYSLFVNVARMEFLDGVIFPEAGRPFTTVSPPCLLPCRV